MLHLLVKNKFDKQLIHNIRVIAELQEQFLFFYLFFDKASHSILLMDML